MFEWRQKGFVQDSDEEEEESQLESQSFKHNGDATERVEQDADSPGDEKEYGLGTQDEKMAEQDGSSQCEDLQEISPVEEGAITPLRTASVRRPTISPFTPKVQREPIREPTESPDPLQNPATSPRIHRLSIPHSAQLRSPAGTLQRPKSPDAQHDIAAVPSQVHGAPKSAQQLPVTTADSPAGAAVILDTFGIAPLSDDSDEELSDPPSDMDISPPTIAGPHRRTTAQIVIPTSASLQRRIEEHRARREFRQRKPIQLHPYALEGELYRREVQSRGLKPVARERSPQRDSRRPNAETQEKDFDPNVSPISSPPEVELPVSIPVPQRLHALAINGSSRRRESDPGKRMPSTQLRHPHAAKKRKSNIPLTQTGARVGRQPVEEVPLPLDIWSIPPNSPPLSSSPPLVGLNSARPVGRLGIASPHPNLPTPATSCVFQDDAQMPVPGSDTESVPRSGHKLSSTLRHPNRIILADSSSADSESSSETEQVSQELKQVKRKIKGVLPASWLRIDKEAQERRQARLRELEQAQRSGRSTHSPEPTAPQRGVAQRIVRPRVYSHGIHTGSIRQNTVSISDDSEPDTAAAVLTPTQDKERSFRDASALAAAFDLRYADEDPSDMEDDQLHLPTLGGTGTKRKKQPKLIDAFERVKRTKGDHAVTKTGGNNKRYSVIGSKRQTKIVSKRRHRTPPPALSVVDVNVTVSPEAHGLPDFLRLARRQALRRPDLARQTPKHKQIRLYNAQDTEDANMTLQQWRQGQLKAIDKPALQASLARTPLIDTSHNRQSIPMETVHENGSTIAKSSKESHTKQSQAQHRSQKKQSLGLGVFRRATTRTLQPLNRGSKSSLKISKVNLQFQRNPPPFRSAQLEGDEGDFGGAHRKVAFEQALRQVEHGFGNANASLHPHMNAQIARFLADDDEPLPPLPSANDIGEHSVGDSIRQPQPKRKRLIRKKVAQRLDVDTREYRQPSEPTVQDVMGTGQITAPPAGNIEPGVSILHDLGSYGTRYPISFDVSYLSSETYFHSATFVGSEELRRALQVGLLGSRNFEKSVGFHTLALHSTTIRCGPWNDETWSVMQSEAKLLTDALQPHSENDALCEDAPDMALNRVTGFVRKLVNHVSSHLSFSDPIDRRDFVTKVLQLSRSVFESVSTSGSNPHEDGSSPSIVQTRIRVFVYLLVLQIQILRIAQHPTVDATERSGIEHLLRLISQVAIAHLTRSGISVLGHFLEQNKLQRVRELGIQEKDVVVESTVVCMLSLASINLPKLGFWDLIGQELRSSATNASSIKTLETIWATVFTFLPYAYVDLSGIPARTSYSTCHPEDWAIIRDLMKRLFDLYPDTFNKSGASLNHYIRANLARCYRLIKYWHWHRPELALNSIFDYYGKNGLRQLRREAGSGSVPFLEDITNEQLLIVDVEENSFHMALKCLAIGLKSMQATLPEKKMRSFVFRTIPNHGRAYPKDQPLDEDSLAALRNHHDLLSTLYWGASASCRPKLEHFRNLVDHEHSHREACRVSVRAWANLSVFQVHIEEPSNAAEPFALWHKDIMHQTLKQYRLAKVEADDYLKSGILGGTSDVSMIMVRQTMERNQEQVIATLRDCIAGMRRVVKHARDQNTLKDFLVNSDIVYLLELPHFEDQRLVNVIRDVLLMLQEYAGRQEVATVPEESHQPSEESQDYGDFPDMDDFEVTESTSSTNVPDLVPQQSGLDFIQQPLWRLLSNAFGAENTPDDNLLMSCIDTWVCVAEQQIKCGQKTWSHYIDSYSQVSWRQLRSTEQTRKFEPYFLTSVIESSTSAYREHKQDFYQALLVCLAERESMLRFQYRLLHAVVRIDPEHPMTRNLPFFRDQEGNWDITSETVRTRRLTLISSILSNLRDDVHAKSLADHKCATEMRRENANMLQNFMAAMKKNYLALQQGSAMTGAYVEFVQTIVRFLKQYTSDICPVIPFFTDSAEFPLPAEDPTYVVGRLCGYAPKVQDSGTSKQLSVFIQTVVQQAAADNQQSYLVDQLTTALCTAETPRADRIALRSVLLEGIVPAYIELALSSATAFTIARPLLQVLPTIIKSMIFDVRVMHPEQLTMVVNPVIIVFQSYIRATEQLKHDPHIFKKNHVLAILTHMFNAASAMVPLLSYICERLDVRGRTIRPALIQYKEQLSVFVAEMLHDLLPHAIPTYLGDMDTPPSSKQYIDLLTFCKRGLNDVMALSWSESHGAVWFGAGHNKREVVMHVGALDEEKKKLIKAIEAFHHTLYRTYASGQRVEDVQYSKHDELFV